MADESGPEVLTEAELEPTHGRSKRPRDDAEPDEPSPEDEAKKSKVDEEESSVEEKHDNHSESAPVSVGPKSFGSSIEMFDYFYKLLHFWAPNLSLNKYEHVVLLELLKKGHLEAQRKIGVGVKDFQVGYHPQFKSRCFFLIREDNSVDDFSFRKCVDHILPLPENLQIKRHVEKALRGGGGGGKWRGRGRGGR